MKLSFATPLPNLAVRRTYFNTANRPSCLRLPPPVSMWDYKSYHHALSAMYINMEIKRIEQAQTGTKVGKKNGLRQREVHIIYHVVVCIGKRKEGEPSVDVFITLTGKS